MELDDFDTGRFRYKVEALASVQIENQLNFLGAQGWELVSVIYQAEQEHPYLCFFKQKVSG